MSKRSHTIHEQLQRYRARLDQLRKEQCAILSGNALEGIYEQKSLEIWRQLQQIEQLLQTSASK